MKKNILRWAGLFVLILVIGVVVQPVGISAQFVFSLLGVLIMVAIRHLPMPKVARQIFLAIGVTIVLRYIYWRATSTLPDTSDMVSFIPGILLFMGELFSVGMLIINLIVIADPIKRNKIHMSGNPNDYPMVDIFVPTYNEDEDIVGTTLAAAVNIDYPEDKFTVYLLDDGGTDAKCNSKDPASAREARARRRDMTKLCEGLGAVYLTRSQNDHAKAGNMNAAMAHTNGEIVVVFDADHAPVRTFLRKTLGYFQKDPKLFLVQTPHFFLNPDPVEKNLGTFADMPSENEMFYSIIQKGLDKWDGAFFCGSGALLRRKALDEVGGFAGLSITEDCETALTLHSRGWSSAYVDEPLMAGFQPETFEAFIGQRSRWCQGMLQIFLLKNPLFIKGLLWKQKAAYLSSMMFWFFPFSRLAFMFAPALYVFFNLEVYNATIQEFVAYTVLFMMTVTQMQNYIYGNVRWPWISELYEYLQSMELAKSIFSVVLNPRKPSFKVTAKGITLENNHFSPQGWPFAWMFVFLFATTATALYRMIAESASNELLGVVTLWSIFNLAIGGLALGAVSERRERRRHYRLNVSLKAMTATMEVDGVVRSVEIEDAAIGGMALRETDIEYNKPFVGKEAKIHLHATGYKKPLHTFEVDLCWAREKSGQSSYGIAFNNPTPRDRRTLALLMFPDSSGLSAKRDRRHGRRSITAGSFTFLRWCIYQSYRGSVAAVKELVIIFRAKRKKAGDKPASEQAPGGEAAKNAA